MAATRGRPLARIPRWIARVLGLTMVLLVAAIAVGEAVSAPTSQPLTLREALMMCAFVLALVGLLAGGRWETLGGALTLVSMAIFFPVHLAFTGRILRGWAFIALLIPAVLFLVAAWRGKSLSGAGEA